MIRKYSKDSYMKAVNVSSAEHPMELPALDYRIINVFFRKGWVSAVYALIYLRKLAVILVRKVRG